MELEIIEKRENPLLDRIEVKFVLHHANQPTPRRESVREELSKSLKVQKDRIVVDNMAPSFGIHDTRGYAKVYSTKEMAINVEREYLLIRNKLVKEEKKVEKGKETAPEEKVTETPEPVKKEEKEEEEAE
jgi:small subunit ribosomal protein S24e